MVLWHFSRLLFSGTGIMVKPEAPSTDPAGRLAAGTAGSDTRLYFYCNKKDKIRQGESLGNLPAAEKGG
jgi:hypothetical protein